MRSRTYSEASTNGYRRFTIEKSGQPDIPAMMVLTVEAFNEVGGSASIQELNEKIAEIEGLTEEEQLIPLSDKDQRAKWRYYLAWARTYLHRVGAVKNTEKGIWTLTEKGAAIVTKALAEKAKKEARELEKEYKKRKKARPETENDAEDQGDAGDEFNDDDLVPDWREKLLETLRSIDPYAFERLSQRILREAGFTKVEVRGKTGDGGIDGVGVLRVNLVSFQVLFQCKRYKGSVGSQEIRNFRGGLQGRADKGLFITTGVFTQQASEEATRDGAIAIDLIDGDRLCDLLKQYNIGVHTEMIEKIKIDHDWFQTI